MAELNHSTLVQFLFHKSPLFNFARLVTELELALQDAASGPTVVTWDCDDIAFHEADGCRFVLAFTDDPASGYAACLTLSVGPAPGFRHAALPIDADEVCHTIATRLETRFQPDLQLWHRVLGAVSSNKIDALLDAVPPVAPAAELVAPVPAHDAFAGAALQGGFADDAEQYVPGAKLAELTGKSAKPAPVTPSRTAPLSLTPGMRASERPFTSALQIMSETAPVLLSANDVPDLPVQKDAALLRVRDALYPAAEPVAAPSAKLRLAAHSMDATLMIVALPVGAAMLTYSLLRGGNVNLSARVMAVTCTAVGILQTTSFGQLGGLL